MDTIARNDHHGHGGLTPIRPARREAEAPIPGSPTGQGDMNEPGDEIDVGTWIFGLSNVDHRTCTAGHHGVGTYAVEQSWRGQRRVRRRSHDRSSTPEQTTGLPRGRNVLVHERGPPLPASVQSRSRKEARSDAQEPTASNFPATARPQPAELREGMTP